MRTIGQLLLFLSIMITCSCIHLEQTIELSDANTGVFSLQVSIPMRVYQNLIGEKNNSPAEGILGYFDPAFGIRHYKKEHGVKIRSYRVYERDGNLHLFIRGDIIDFGNVCSSGILGNLSLLKENGLQTIRLDFDPILTNTKNPQVIEERKKLAAGMRLSLTIVTPGTISETSGINVGEREARWIFDSAEKELFLHQLPEIYVRYQ